MNLSEPVGNVEQLTPGLLTERLKKNGFLAAGSVTAAEGGDTFEILRRDLVSDQAGVQ